MDGLKEELAGSLDVLTVNIASDAGMELGRIYGSRVTPTFIFLDGDGEEVWRSIGRLEPDRVRESLASR